MPRILETDAFALARGIDTMDEAQRPQALDILARYKRQQEDNGEPEWPSQAQARQDASDRLRGFFDDLKTVDAAAPSLAAVLPYSENPDADRARVANTAYLASRYGKTPDEIGASYELWRDDYATRFLQAPKGLDDLAFHASAKNEIARLKQKEDTEAEGVKSALRGDDVIPALQAWQTKNLDRMPDSTEFTRGFLQARESIAGVGVSDAVDAYQRAMQGSPKDGDAETLKDFEALLLDLPGVKRKAVLTAAAMMAQARGENSVKGVGARESGPMGVAGSAINAITGFFQEIGESGGRFVGKFGGIAKDEELESMANLPALPLLTDAAKARHPLASGVAYTSMAKIDTAEKAADFIKEWKVASFGTASADVTRADIEEAGQSEKQYRELDADEKKFIEAAQKRELKKNQIARELRSIAESSDPVGEISGAIGSSVAMAAANIITRGKTLPISWQLYSEANYDQLRLENPSLEPSEARAISRVSGAGEAAWDALEIGILRKLPSVAAVLKSGTSAAWRNAGARLGATFAFEQAQEGVQDLTLPFTRAVFEAVGRDTGLDMAAEWERWKDSRGTVAIASIPLILLGAGIATHRDIKDAQNWLSSRDRLGEQGIIEVDAVPIIEAAQAGKMEEAQALYRNAFKRRSTEVAAEYQAKLETQQKATAEAIVEVTRLGLIPEYTLLPGGKVVVTDLSDGSKATFDSWRDAQPVIEQNMNEMERINNDSILRIADDILQRGEEVTVSPRSSESLADRVRGGSMSPEDAIKAAIAGNVIKGVSIDEARQIAADVFGESQEERIKIMREAVERAIVLGSNVVQNGVSKSKLFKGANLTTLIEETSEGRLKEGLRLGRYKKSDWLGLIQQAEEATGEKFLIGSTADAVNASPDFAPRELIEAVSRIVVADVLGRLQDGRRIGSGSITKSLEENNSPLVAWIRAFKRLLASVLRTAKRIREARKTGKLGDEYDAYIDDLLGVDQQAAFESEAAIEAEAIANEALYAGGASYSEENPGPNGETFSLARAVPADSSRFVQMPDGAQLVGPTTFSISPRDSEFVENASDAAASRSAAESKVIADLVKAPSFKSEGLGSLDIPSQRAVMLGVFRVGHDLKVLDSVIELIPVDVMDMLRSKELTPNALFNDQAMFEELFVPDGNGAIASGVDSATALLRAVALGAAKSSAGYFAGAAINNGSTNSAGDFHILKQTRNAADGQTFSLTVYHGTPHKVDKFRLANIGTGEGAQAFGWGLYFAQEKQVAEGYQSRIAGAQWVDKAGRQRTAIEIGEAVYDQARKDGYSVKDADELRSYWSAYAQNGGMQNTQGIESIRAVVDGQGIKLKRSGNLYTVELLPDEDEFLDWDKPLSEQSEKVKAALGKWRPGLPYSTATGAEAYESLTDSEYSAHIQSGGTGSKTIEFTQKVSKRLASLGIPGIRFLDGNSRDGGSGTSNYVIFDESLVKILEENGKPVSGETFSIRSISPAQDAEYMAAVESGDVAKQQAMVDAAARRAGYDVGPVWHGTPKAKAQTVDEIVRDAKQGLTTADFPFDTFSTNYKTEPGIFFHDSQRSARLYAKATGAVGRFFLKGVKPRRQLGDGKEYVATDPNQIKSADPITRDQSGNVIPLSQRFNPERNEITFSLRKFDFSSKLAPAAEILRSMKQGGKAFDFSSAYRAASAGQSTSMLSLSALYDEAKKQNPALTEADFGKQVQALYDSGNLMLEPGEQADSMRDTLGRFGVRDSLGIPAMFARPMETEQETFSIRSGDFASRMSAAFSPFQRNPELRMAIAQVAKARAQRLGAEWIEKAGVLRTVGSIAKEQGIREALGYDQRINAYLESLTPSARQELEFEPASLEDDPLVAAMLDYGKLMSRSTALKNGVKNLDEFDGVPWLPPAWYSKGAGITPGAMAKAMHEGPRGEGGPLSAGDSAQDLWEALGQIIASTKKNKAAHREAVQAYKEAQRAARTDAKLEAESWANQTRKAAGSPKAQRDMLKGALRLLDGILAAAPPEVRAKVGGYVKLAGLATDEAMLDEIERRIEKLNSELEKWLKKEIHTQLDKLFERAAPKMEAGKKPKGSMTPEAHRAVMLAREAMAVAEKSMDGKRYELQQALMEPDADLAGIMEEMQVLELFGGMDAQNAESMSAALEWLSATVKNGKNRWRMLAEQRLTELRENADALQQDTGTPHDIASLQDDLANEKTVKRAAGGWAYNLISFEQVMTKLFGEDSKVARKLVDSIRQATYQRTDAVRAKRDEFIDVMRRVFGSLNYQERLWDFAQTDAETAMTISWMKDRKETTVKVPVDTVRKIIEDRASAKALGFDDAEIISLMEQFAANDDLPGNRQKDNLTITRLSPGTPTALKLSQNQAINLTMLARQKDYQDTLTFHGYTPEVIAEIESKLEPEAKEIRAFLARQYEDGYQSINSVFQGMYGAPLPKIANYSPGTWEALAGEAVVDPDGSGMVGGGLSASALKTRRVHRAAPRLADALVTYWQHVGTTEYFKAFAAPVRDLRGILLRPEVRAAITAKGGSAGITAAQDWVKIFENDGVKQAHSLGEIEKFQSRLQQAVSIGALAWNLGTLAKQSTAILGAYYEMPTSAYLKGFARLLRGQLEMSAIMKSDMIRRRVEAGASPELRQVMAGMLGQYPGSNQIIRGGRAFATRGMEILGETDGFFTAASAAIYFDYARNEALASGMNEEQSSAEAIRRTEAMVDRTAQPVEMMTRSLFENKLAATPSGKWLFMFASEARQKAALYGMAVGRIAKGNGTAADGRVMFIAHVVAPLMLQTIANMIGDWRDDDDDELFDEKNWNSMRYVKSMLLGPAMGIPLLSGPLNSILSIATGQPSYENDPTNPLGSTISKVIGGSYRLASGKGHKNDELEQGVNVMKYALQAVAAASSISPVGGGNAWLGAAGSVMDQVFDMANNILADKK